MEIITWLWININNLFSSNELIFQQNGKDATGMRLEAK